MRGELKELEAWFVDRGHLSKKWRIDLGCGSNQMRVFISLTAPLFWLEWLVQFAILQELKGSVSVC